jgi:hypothetical protein
LYFIISHSFPDKYATEAAIAPLVIKKHFFNCTLNPPLAPQDTKSATLRLCAE